MPFTASKKALFPITPDPIVEHVSNLFSQISGVLILDLESRSILILKD